MVDEKNKKKARLSWYHPDDTVRSGCVPHAPRRACRRAGSSALHRSTELIGFDGVTVHNLRAQPPS